MNSNLATQVSFLAPRTLTVTGGGAGAGTVTSLPAGTSCSIGAGVATGTCAVAYADATSVTLTAAASAGSTFTGWSGACTGVTCLVAMTTARSVTATFTGSSSVSQSTVTSSPASIVAGGAAATITVTVRDAGGNPLSGNAVTLTATGPGTLSIVQPLASTNASGVATGSVSGNVAGAYSVIARINGTSTIAQQATVTVSAGAANNITQFGTFASTGARFGQGVATLPAVVLRDAFANPVSGVTVTFSVDKGLATIGNGVTTSGSTVGVVTDASGVAQLASWTLSSVNSAGNYSPTIDVNNMVRATTAGIATSVVFATAVDVSYAADIQTIWDKSTGVIKSCSASGCHAAGGFAPILVAPSRTALTSAYLSPGDSVTTNNSVNRLLYRLVSGAPIMPQGYTALPPNVIGIIRAYIKQGAPGN